MGFSGVCYRLVGDLLQALGRVSSGSTTADKDQTNSIISKQQNVTKIIDESNLMVSALITVFGMQKNGRIKKEKAKRVVEKLGLIQNEEEKARFELPAAGGNGIGGDEDEEEVLIEEVLGVGGLNVEEEEEKGLKSNELLQEAFKIFDIDGDGFIEVMELKRVLECLGLDNGWEISEIEKMVRVVDVNLDGKVDFSEFELMMG